MTRARSATPAAVSSSSGDLLRRDLTLTRDRQQLAVSLWADRQQAAAGVLFCLPGGGMTRGYYDLRVPDNDSHSFARAMTARGYVVAAMDHPGTGDSAGGEDLYVHTPERLAAAATWACETVRSGLSDGSLLPELGALPEGLPVIGVGHSMGAMIICLAQAQQGCFDALALLGFSTRGLPEYVPDPVKALLRDDPERLQQQRVALARAMFSAMGGQDEGRSADRNQDLFGRGNAEPDGARALRDCAAPILPVPAFVSMLPGNIAVQAGAVSTAVFLALGERDMAGPPHAVPAAFSGSSDVTLHILDGAGHSHFLFPARHALFARLDHWVRGLQSC